MDHIDSQFQITDNISKRYKFIIFLARIAEENAFILIHFSKIEMYQDEALLEK